MDKRSAISSVIGTQVRQSVLLLVMSLFCGSGCSDGGIGEVSGKVTLDGRPLPGATVMFQPAVGRPSYGVTDSSGCYALQYNPDTDGAVVGDLTVQIRTGRQDMDFKTGIMKVTPEILPSRFHDKTELKRTVKAGRNVINFELDSK